MATTSEEYPVSGTGCHTALHILSCRVQQYLPGHDLNPPILIQTANDKPAFSTLANHSPGTIFRGIATPISEYLRNDSENIHHYVTRAKIVLSGI